MRKERKNERKFVFIEANDKNTNQLKFHWAELEADSNEKTVPFFFQYIFSLANAEFESKHAWRAIIEQNNAHVQIVIIFVRFYFTRYFLFIFKSRSRSLSLSLTWSFVLLDFNIFVHFVHCLFCHFMLQLQSDESSENCLAPRIARGADYSSQFPFSFFSFSIFVAHQNRSVFIKYLITAKEGEMAARVLARYRHCTVCNVLLCSRKYIFLNRAYWKRCSLLFNFQSIFWSIYSRWRRECVSVCKMLNWSVNTANVRTSTEHRRTYHEKVFRSTISFILFIQSTFGWAHAKSSRDSHWAVV